MPALVKRVPLLGILSLIFFLIHASGYARTGQLEEVLWACDLAAAFVGLGLIIGLPTLNGIAVMWLAFGFPAWSIDCLTGGEFLPTSVLIHFGSLLIGLLGIRRIGLPAGTWWKAVIAAFALHMLCRWVTSPAANINIAHTMWRGWDRVFHSHMQYVAFVHGVFAIFFWSLEATLRRLFWGVPIFGKGRVAPPAEQQRRGGQH